MKDAAARAAVMAEVMNKLTEPLSYLYGRYLDEREHEDFAEYEKVLKQRVAAAAPTAEFIKATKRPFGCIIKPEGFPYQVQILVNSKSLGWKSIK